MEVRRRTLLLLGLAWALLPAVAGAEPFPGAHPPAPEPPEVAYLPGLRLVAVTFNLWGLPWPLSHPGWERRLPRVESFLRRGDYAVLAVQEAWAHALRELEPPPDCVPLGQGDAGLALYLRPPVLACAGEGLHVYREAVGVDRWKQKGVQVARLLLEGGIRLWVFNTHLQARPLPRAARVRGQQVEELLDLAAERPGPALLLGDFNFHRGLAYDELLDAELEAAGFHNAAAELGRSDLVTDLTGPHRYDRVYLRDGEDGGVRYCLEPLSVEALRLHRLGGVVSDHRPVRVELWLGPCPPPPGSLAP